jgi:hypothetical protein
MTVRGGDVRSHEQLSRLDGALMAAAVLMASEPKLTSAQVEVLRTYTTRVDACAAGEPGADSS